MALKLSNNAISRLSASLPAGGLSLSVIPGEGSRFPTLSAGDYFPLTLIRASDGAIEIVRVTARSSDVMTIQRAKESTSALSFSAGDRVELRLTAGTMEEFKEEVVTINEATHSAPSKATPSDADEIPIADSAASFSLKKLTFANLKAYLNTIYGKVSEVAKNGLIADSGLTQGSGKLLGRTTSGTGAVEEISVGGSLSLSSGVLTVTVPVTSVGGQTGAVTAQQLLDAIKTVDGTGSGLDADTLDGLNASSFLSSDVGARQVGSFAMVSFLSPNTGGAAGAAISGSLLYQIGSGSGFTPPGTWRLMGDMLQQQQIQIAQRIA